LGHFAVSTSLLTKKLGGQTAFQRRGIHSLFFLSLLELFVLYLLCL